MTLSIGAFQIRINWLILLCFISSMGMFISLAFWQLDRAAEKRELAATLERRSQAGAQSLEQAETDTDFGSMSKVVINGRYENDIPFLVTFQFFQGRAGYEVISPFRLSDGSLVLLSRGWLSPAEAGELPDIPRVDGEQQLQAQVYIPDQPVPAGTVTDTSWPVRLARLNIDQAERLLGEPVRPYVLRIDSGQPGVLARHWQMPRISTRTHYAYALQWFAIALVVGLATLLYSSNLLSLLRARRSQH